MQIKGNVYFTSMQRALHILFSFYSPNNPMMRPLLPRKNNLLAQGQWLVRARMRILTQKVRLRGFTLIQYAVFTNDRNKSVGIKIF